MRPVGSIPLDFIVKLDFPVTNGKITAKISSNTLYENLAFSKEDNEYVAKLNYFLRVAAAKDRRVVGFIEAFPLVTIPDLEQAVRMKQSLLISHLIDLPPANYVLDVFLRDIQSGCRGAETLKFTIHTP